MAIFQGEIDMDEKKLKIISASVCKFNVHIDIDGSLAPEISPKACEEPCGYCQMVSEYICQQLEEGSENVVK